MSAQTASPSHRPPDPAEPAAPSIHERWSRLRQGVLLPVTPEGWLLLGGCALSLLGLFVTASAWPSIISDEFGSLVEGSAAWSAVGIAVAAIGGLMCVAAAAAYGVLLGQEHAARGADRD